MGFLNYLVCRFCKTRLALWLAMTLWIVFPEGCQFIISRLEKKLEKK